jgi:hypothetical protein
MAATATMIETLEINEGPYRSSGKRAGETPALRL